MRGEEAVLVYQAVLLLCVLAVVVGLGYVAFHFFDQFSRRRHPGSIVAGSLPLGWALAALLVLDPEGAAQWRPLVLSAALVIATGCSVTTYFNRRRDAEERRRRR